MMGYKFGVQLAIRVNFASLSGLTIGAWKITCIQTSWNLCSRVRLPLEVRGFAEEKEA